MHRIHIIDSHTGGEAICVSISFGEGMIFFDWQEIFLILSIIATIAGGIRLCSSDPKSWRIGGIILLFIPVTFYLLLVLSAVLGQESLNNPSWLLFLAVPWVIHNLRSGNKRERQYVIILLAAVGLIGFIFWWCVRRIEQ